MEGARTQNDLQVLSVLVGKPQPALATPSAITQFEGGKPVYVNSRLLSRYDSSDILKELAVRFIDLGGDGKGPNGLDRCLRCGLATLQSGRSVVVMRCCTSVKSLAALNCFGMWMTVFSN